MKIVTRSVEAQRNGDEWLVMFEDETRPFLLAQDVVTYVRAKDARECKKTGQCIATTITWPAGFQPPEGR